MVPFIYDQDKQKTLYEYRISIPPSILAPNTYSFRLAIFSPDGKEYDILESECQFKINDTGTAFSNFEGIDYGSVILDFKWEENKMV
jgi:lipopolysaccharide transport system ATP-binding protein